MRKIIKNLCYDTNTARQCSEYSENKVGDATYYREVLMLKKSGEFFLWACGENNSKYAKVTSSGWIGQEVIVPLSLDAARSWAEKHMDAVDYDLLFGTAALTEKETLSIYIDSSLVKKVRQLAREQRRSISAVVEEILIKSTL